MTTLPPDSPPVRRIAALLLLLTTSTVLAQGRGGPPGGPPEPPPVPDVDKESLIYDVPDKWYPYSRSTDDKDETFIFPTGQKPDSWKQAFRVEQFHSTLGVSDARQAFDHKTQANASSCNSHDVTVLRESDENGYSVMLWTESCETARKKTTVMLNKVIVGAERLYIVSKIWTRIPRDSDLDRWRRRLDDVFVCDPNTGNNPCTFLRNRQNAGSAGGGRPPPATIMAMGPPDLAPSPPPQMPLSDSTPDLITTYKIAGDSELQLHIFYPEQTAEDVAPGVLVYLHGGGLRRGSPTQGYEIADRFVPEGIAVVAVQYRLLDEAGTVTLDQIIADGKSSIRYLRAHADELHIDPKRVALMGHSAGAYLTLSTAILTGLDEPSEDLTISAMPDAIIPWSAIPRRREAGADAYATDSQLRAGLPPALFIHGSSDPIAAPEVALTFEQQYRAEGNDSAFHMIEGADHFFADAEQRSHVMRLISEFLSVNGFTSGGEHQQEQ